MQKIYERKITHIGNFVEESYDDNFFILFNSNAPKEYKDYCILHSGTKLYKNIKVGDVLILGNTKYLITSFGSVVNKNLSELGHITLKFDGASIPEQPGTLHLEKKEIVKLSIDEKLEIISL